MTDTDTPSGGSTAAGDSVAPGRPDEQALAALPDKVRVHALARVVGTSSRELLAVLARIGVGARSAQSSVDRGVVAQVMDDLFPPPGGPVADPVAEATAALTPSPDEEASEPEAPLTLSAGTPTAGGPASAPAFAAPMFLAPDSTSEEAVPTRARRRRGSRSTGVVTPGESTETEITGDHTPASAEEETPAAAAEDSGETAADTGGPSRRRRRRSGADESAEASDTSETPDATDPSDSSESSDSSDSADSSDSDDDDEDGSRRRRRRGRRGRGRGRGGADDAESGDGSADGDGEAGTDSSEKSESESGSGEGDDDEEDTDSGESEDSDGSSGGSRRRRRRRRRSSEGDGDGEVEDPPNTVTHVRDRVERPEGGKSSNDEIRGVKGSTRLEAKRQRRRDGRESGRRRPSILSESEFLARREAVERTMVVRQHAGRSQIGVLEDGVLVEHFVAGDGQNSMVGNVYLGRVQNVLPSMEAAFVDIGRGRNAVLYAGEVNWDASGLEGKQRKIEQALSSGDQVLVQVTKDPVGHKGARLTTQISLPGRFLVYVPAGGATGISRKLPDTERKRLKEILKRIVPDESGVIIRTAAEGVSEEDLERDVRRLTAQWEAIDKSASEAGNKNSKGPTLVYEEPDLLIRVVRDMFNEDFSSLVVSGERAWETLEGYVSHVAPELAGRLSRHVGPEDVFAAYRIDEQLIKALDRKVWLPSGGTLVIDRTEAMTVVDVNTGKFTGSGGNLEETVTRNNLEAAEEIVRQLRLRDIGGMIVIDFIDMVLESNRDLVLRRLTECLGRDRTRHQVSEVTSLGLVQMTRKRVGQGLLDEFSTTCEHCRGRGVIVSSEPVMANEQGGSNGGEKAGSAEKNGSGDKNGSGEKVASGTGGGSSSRRGRRGRRAERSEGASPSVVAAASGLTAGRDDDDAVSEEIGADETATDVVETVDTVDTSDSGTAESPETAAVPVEGADETEVALEAGLAEASPGAGSVEETDEAPAEADLPAAAETEDVEEAIHEAVEAEVALEADLAEHVPGGNGTTPEPATSSAPRVTGAIGAATGNGNGHGGDTVITPAGSPAEPEDEATPEPAVVPTGSGSARPRRRRAASRPAGPPAGGSSD
ncbi:Rne/Rng family ribonuclease [Actinomycetospora sp. NBC_00405]|uniref:Rne/Rng family ribonuclease n=1 Tax=Actinomycetospora sp. NBC_00405 TaxID=2975952 RepID=UPI002E23EEA8